MADERKIVIELKANDILSSNASLNNADEESSENLTGLLKTMQHPVSSLEQATLGKNVLVYRLYESAKQTIKSTALYSAQKYFNLTENYKAQMDLNNTLSVIEHISNIGTSILGGAIAGAKFGPGGAFAGAVAGTITAGVNVAINAAKAWDQQNLSLTQMNMQSAFQRTRLGLVDDGRGTLN